MGIYINALKSFNLLIKEDIKIKNVLTLGRQQINIEPKKILKYIKVCFNGEKLKIDDIKYKDYSEILLKRIFCTKNTDSIDYSDYEQASIVWDMNMPIPELYKNKYDLVFDGGTLEHVFNFPVAIKNAMGMVKVGGYFLSITCCNNFSGHGFYQFSPELFFRIFSKENGFEIIYMFISVDGVFYKVKDPKEVKGRVTFLNNKETELVVIAKKINIVEIFKEVPYQSDYLSIWDNDKAVKFVQERNIIKRFRRKMGFLKSKLGLYYNEQFFEKYK